jgi:hypothetical protein
MIILPRQAQDEHRGNSKKEMCFSQVSPVPTPTPRPSEMLADLHTQVSAAAVAQAGASPFRPVAKALPAAEWTAAHGVPPSPRLQSKMEQVEAAREELRQLTALAAAGGGGRR